MMWNCSFLSFIERLSWQHTGALLLEGKNPRSTPGRAASTGSLSLFSFHKKTIFREKGPNARLHRLLLQRSRQPDIQRVQHAYNSHNVFLKETCGLDLLSNKPDMRDPFGRGPCETIPGLKGGSSISTLEGGISGFTFEVHSRTACRMRGCRHWGL